MSVGVVKIFNRFAYRLRHEELKGDLIDIASHFNVKNAFELLA